MGNLYALAGRANAGIFQARRRAQEIMPAQGSVEWILIVAFVAIALIAGYIALSDVMNDKLTDITDTLTSTTPQGHTPTPGA